jgi:hypothetical protein
MKKLHFGGALLLVAGAALAWAGVQDYNLKRTAKEGEVFKYKLNGTMEVMGTSVTLSAIMINKTTKVEANGDYTVESSQTEGKISFNGSEMEMPSSGSTMTTYKADGTVLDVKGEGVEMGGYRMANLLAAIMPEKPIKAGDTWTSSVKGDAKKGTVDVNGTYKFEAVEKGDSGETAKVTYELKETNGEAPATVSGTAWLELKTGNLIKIESKWKDVPVPGAPTPVTGTMTMVLIP